MLPELRLALRSTLFQARHGNEAVTSRPVELGQMQVEIAVHPHKDEPSGSECLLVVFEERVPDPSLLPTSAIRQTDSMVLNNWSASCNAPAFSCRKPSSNRKFQRRADRLQ